MATAIDFFININLISETGASKAFFGVRANPYAAYFPEIIKSLFHNSFPPANSPFSEIRVDF